MIFCHEVRSVRLVNCITVVVCELFQALLALADAIPYEKPYMYCLSDTPLILSTTLDHHKWFSECCTGQ